MKETGEVFEEAYGGVSEPSEVMAGGRLFTYGECDEWPSTFFTPLCSRWSATSNPFCRCFESFGNKPESVS